jgi:TonB family protein
MTTSKLSTSLTALIVTAWMAANGPSAHLRAQQAGSAASAGCHEEAVVPDEDISVTSFAEMGYPTIARVARIQGMVVVHLDLDTQGRVRTARVVSGPKLLVGDVLVNARKWAFKPNATKAAVLVYDFRVDGLCETESAGFFRLQPPNRVLITGCTTPAQP